MTIKIFTIAHVPPELEQPWLQHLRDFDVAHPGCHFEVGIDAPNKTMAECVETLRLNPQLTFQQIFARSSPQAKAELVQAIDDRLADISHGKPVASGSVECPHCHWGFDPSVINQHIREKH